MFLKHFRQIALRILVIVLLLALALPGVTQSLLSRRISSVTAGVPLADFLNEFTRTNQGTFFFRSEWTAGINLKSNYAGFTVAELLEDALRGTDLSFFEMYPTVVVILKDPEQTIERQRALELVARQSRSVETIFFGSPGASRKELLQLKGRVVDAKNDEPLVGAAVTLGTQGRGATTDHTGSFLLELRPGAYVLQVAYLDYEPRAIDVALFDDGNLDLKLDKEPTMLEELVVRDIATRDLATSRVGQIQISVKELKRMPSFLGEADIVKQVQNLPGVTTVGEAATGFNVRGGGVDQNLILYDGLPVFNSSHVFGILSSFHADAIRDVSFFRGGIPAEYGGRASSVLDLRSKDGDYEKWSGSAGLGLITSQVSVGGPLRKDRSSLMASFRTTYSNWLARSIRTDYVDLRNSSVSFFDGTVKFAQRLRDQSKISVSLYGSNDGFRLLKDTSYQWGQWLAAIRWDKPAKRGWTSDYVIGTSVYGYKVLNNNFRSASSLSYQLQTNLFTAGFHKAEGVRKYSAGLQVQHTGFQPGRLRAESSESTARNYELDRQNSIESALYGSGEWILKTNITMEGGVRLPLFLSVGSARVPIYSSGQVPSANNVVDTAYFKRGQLIKAYAGVEPRLAVRWALSATGSLKLSYNRINQFLHLITNTTAVTPVDIWQPSGYYFRPQRADQVSLGYFKDSKQKRFQYSAEMYYKYIANLLDFKDGANLIMNPALERELLRGFGESYGMELLLAKMEGRLTGNMNYTYARSFRTIAGATPSESINRGKRYNSNFDQPHVGNLSWRYQLSRRYFFTGNFTYRTGRPVTVPLAAFVFENGTVAYFSERNQYRIPDYHRLDVAFVFEGNHRKRQRWKGTWTLSAYNVYARRNPYTVFFQTSSTGVPTPYQLAIIGTILPSLSYTLKFE